MRILAVDDDEDFLEILRLQFGQAGIDVVTCTSGNAALRLLEEQKFDVAVVDLMMPIMDGNVLCKHIRGKSHHADLPIVMMTHMGNVRFIRAASPGDTSHFVNKDGEPDWLIQLVRDLSGRRTARRQV
jgi:DNA-binding response OmpR family regulator